MNNKKKVLFVINYFYPDVASTGQLMTDLCLSLQDDIEITVIAAQPNYAGEKILNSNRIEKEFLENVKIHRILLPEVNKKSKFSRIKYMISYFFWSLVTILKEKNFDIVYTISQPPILGGLIGTITKFIKKTKHIYNVQDFNPEQAMAINYTSKRFIFNIAKQIDKLNCYYADEVVLVGNDMVETLKKRFQKKIPSYSVINNWTNEKDIIPLKKDDPNVKSFLKEYNMSDKFIIMYSGNIGLYYDLENIIKLASRFKDNKRVSFVFIGEGAVKNDLIKYTESQKLTNVKFIPYQHKDYIKYSLNAADIHLVVNQKGIKGVSVPSKIYGVMATGKPILGVLESGSEAANLINKSNCGVLVEPHDYVGIYESILKLCDKSSEELINMGMNGRAYLEVNLKKEISLEKYKKLLLEL